MNPKQIVMVAVTYIAVAALSYGGFSLAFAQGFTPSGAGGLTKLLTPAVPTSSGGVGLDASLPKTEVCPLNGLKYTAPEKEAWSKVRPMAVMIENQVDARPQSGLTKADIVYEAVAEGGITRFMAMFYCGAQAKDVIVAPVRSARQYFMDIASEYNYPLYVHVGGANGDDSDPRVQALEHLSDWGWTNYNDLNQFSIGYPVFVRNYDRVPGKELATEHTMESSTARLWDYAKTKRGLTNLDKNGVDWMSTFTKWTFGDDAAQADRPASQSIAYSFWSGFNDYSVSWAYDNSSNSYKRSMAGQAHLDQNDQSQVTSKNVVIVYAKELGPLDVHKHMFYQVTGTGKAIVFENGKQVQATWAKKDRASRMMFTDSKGKAIAFVPGQIWISILGENTPVTVQ